MMDALIEKGVGEAGDQLNEFAVKFHAMPIVNLDLYIHRRRKQGGKGPPALRSEEGGHRGAPSLHALSNSNLPHIALVGS